MHASADNVPRGEGNTYRLAPSNMKSMKLQFLEMKRDMISDKFLGLVLKRKDEETVSRNSLPFIPAFSLEKFWRQIIVLEVLFQAPISSVSCPSQRMLCKESSHQLQVGRKGKVAVELSILSKKCRYMIQIDIRWCLVSDGKSSSPSPKMMKQCLCLVKILEIHHAFWRYWSRSFWQELQIWTTSVSWLNMEYIKTRMYRYVSICKCIDMCL